jgi:type I restriction enzyme S subunit
MKLKPYPKYQDSCIGWLGEMPEHWNLLPCRGFVLERRVKNEDGTNQNYLSLMANIGVIPYEDKGDVGNKKPEDLTKCKLVYKGDFVINSMNYGIGSYGLSSYDGVCSPVYIVLTPKNEIVKTGFATRVFENKAFQGHAQSFGNGILEHRAAINWDILKGISVGIPPIEEQSIILNFLDRETAKLDTLISKQEKLIELLQEKRQAIISHAVTKGLDPNVKMKDSGVEWLGMVPEDWKILQFRHMVSIQNGSDYKDIESEDGPYPVIGSGGQFKKATNYIYDGASVLLGRKGTIDKPLYVEGKFWVVDTMFYTIIKEIVLPKYVFNCAKIIPFDLLSTSTALPSMTQNDLKTLCFAMPKTVSEQKSIIDFIENQTAKIDLLIEKAKQSIDLAKEHRTALISAAVTGKIDVREYA